MPFLEKYLIDWSLASLLLLVTQVVGCKRKVIMMKEKNNKLSISIYFSKYIRKTMDFLL